MKPVNRSLPFVVALLAGVVASGSLFFGQFAANAEVGVTAAVNRDARSQPPGKAPRVLKLGQAVIFNEKISTDRRGLVQILLLDGTTFTVGPNSRLTIDEFVYNPNTGSAKVVATLTRGAFRFVGARTSQKAGGVTIKTPVGTIGIRGAATNISYNPGDKELTASLLFGSSITFTTGGGTTKTVYESGYTLVVTKTAGGTEAVIHKTTSEEAAAFQALVSGKPGQNGGTGKPPTDQTVSTSGVGAVNSQTQRGEDQKLLPVQSSTPEDVNDLDGITGQTTNGAVTPVCTSYYGCGSY